MAKNKNLNKYVAAGRKQTNRCKAVREFVEIMVHVTAKVGNACAGLGS